LITDIVQFPIPFTKMNGAGNDFIVIDHRHPCIPAEVMAEFARLVCRRRFSIGADGLILLEPSSRADFRWQFFNSDGSVAEMCGNGARCAARFAHLHGLAPKRLRFETLAGMVQATVEDNEVTLDMPDPFDIALDQHLAVEGRTLTLHGANTGVPHVVSIVDRTGDIDVVHLGRTIRMDPCFAPAGTNVNFASRDGDRLQVRTYERGVEAETLACGTGCVASALVAALRLDMSPPVRVVTVGGVELVVGFALAPGPSATAVTLTGPAHIVCTGELTAEALANPSCEAGSPCSTDSITSIPTL
jgi:diaminopimelate epimerase